MSHHYRFEIETWNGYVGGDDKNRAPDVVSFEINHDKSERKNVSCTSINQESKKTISKKKSK